MSSEEQAKRLYERGNRLAWIEQKKTAGLKAYRAALEIWPSYAEAHSRIGQIHFFARKRRLEEALQEFREAVRLKPDWSEGHLWCGHALGEMERFDEAITEYQEAIRLDPNDSRPYTSLGLELGKLGRHAEAVAAFRRAVELNTSYGIIGDHMMLADALKEAGQLQEALQVWRTVAGMRAVWDYEQGEPERAQALLAQFGT